MFSIENNCKLTPSKMPTDLPLGGIQCQKKAFPPQKVFKLLSEKFLL
jgi:hypothetical protein